MASKPDVALIEEALPDVGGLAATKEMRARVPTCRVLLLAAHDHLKEKALGSGALGYVLRSQLPAHIIAAVQAAGRNEVYLPELSPDFDVARLDHPAFATLSKREREIFELAVGGLTNDNMASRLQISVKTVETHRAHINRKLGVHSTAELVRFAAYQGLLR